MDTKNIVQRIQLRRAQLYIADEIKRICELHHIKYFLDCGSMLGAVRHQGFIPWDDDMDIGMMKEDYEKFLKICENELKDEFFLDNYETNPANALVYSKMRLKGTKYIEEKGNAEAKHNEIFVDIFPYFSISDNAFKRKLDGALLAGMSQAILSKSGYKVWKGESKLKRLKFIPTDIVGKILTKKGMHRAVNRIVNKYKDTKMVCIHSGSCYDYWYVPKEIFDSMIEVKFEDRTYLIPKQYDVYLKTAYGNYMELPPENKRTTHSIVNLQMGPYQF